MVGRAYRHVTTKMVTKFSYPWCSAARTSSAVEFRYDSVFGIFWDEMLLGRNVVKTGNS